MITKDSLFEVLRSEGCFLLFRSVKLDLERLGNAYLVFGLLTAWLAGMGRYWDNSRANLFQHLGMGSVIYVFILALFLWLVIKPLQPKNWSYKNVLIFVGLTSPLGWLYAIPVEKFFSLSVAGMINVWFLAIVAVWRVTLWALYLKRAAQLKGFTTVIATLLPIAFIITVLTFLI